MESKYSRFGKNILMVFFGKAGSRVIGLLMLPFYTHYLTTEEYGETDLINTYASIILPLVTCCIADAIFIFPKNASFEGRSKYYTTGWMFVLASFTIYAIVSLLFEVLNGYFELPGVVKQDLWWIFLMTVVLFLQGFTQQFTRSIDKMLVFSLTGIVHVISLAILAIFLVPEYKLEGYLLSIILSNSIAAVYSTIHSGAYRYFNIKYISMPHLKELLSYSIPLIPNSIMWWFVNGINRPVMESTLGLSAVGILAVSNKFPTMITLLSSIVSNAWDISTLEEFEKKDYNHFFNQTLRVFLLVLLTGAFVISIFSKLIVSIFAASEFFEAWRYVPALTLGAVLQCLSGMIGSVFMGMKKSKYFFYSSIWGAGISLIVTYPLVKWFGLMGAPLAIIFSFLGMTIARMYYAWPKINEMKVSYYLAALIIFVMLIIVITADVNILFNIVAVVVAMSAMIVLNRKELVLIKKNIRLRKK